jgi:dolichyl-phosphate beta-glucosyltransferase
MKPHLSIIIPVYNGGPMIRENALKVLKYADGFDREGGKGGEGGDWPVELILVNDGSTDDTGRELGAIDDDRVKILRNDRNRGKGYSVKRGMLEATGAYRVFFDADLAYPVEQTDNLLKFLKEGYDVVIGSRVHEESRFILHCSDLRYIFRRHLLSRAFNFFLRLFLLRDIYDTQSGFKGFTGEAAEYVFSRQMSSDFSFDIEALFIAQRAGLKIKEVPVTMEYHGGPSAVKMVGDSSSMFLRVARIRLKNLIGGYNIKRKR